MVNWLTCALFKPICFKDLLTSHLLQSSHIMSIRRCNWGGSPPLTAVLLMMLLLCMGAIPLCLGRCMEGERSALLSLKAANPQAAGWLSSWTGQDCCSWTGVGCDNTTGHVIKLHLSCPAPAADFFYYYIHPSPTCLQEVNSSLLGLTRLKHLDLSNNNFTSLHIPYFIGSLVSLEYLNLSDAGFVGTVSSQLGNLSSLRFLDLSNSYYTDSLVVDDLEWLSRIPSLQYLDMSGQNLSTARNWLHQINRLPSLKVLRLSDAYLSSIPNALSHVNLSSLVTLDLSYNSLVVDDLDLEWLSRIPSLQYLDMSGNNLSTAPNWLHHINRLPSLRLLRLSDAGLSSIPNALSLVNLSSLVTLDLSINSFESAIPRWLFNLSSSLANLDVSNNNFNGGLPTTPPHAKANNLVMLDLFCNSFESAIPLWLFNISSLVHLDLGDNQFSGELPISKGDSSSLQVLNIWDNNIRGVIPDALGNLSHLDELDLSGNQITGGIPESTGRLSKLKELDLSGNQITGGIPESIGRLSKLKELDLSGNQITGGIPESIGNLSDLQELDMSSNNISGQIPETMGKLHLLTSLDLSNNIIDGEIPATLGSLCMSEDLDLSNNSIGGEITGLIEGLSKCAMSSTNNNGLHILNLDHNRLNGTVPESLGQLHTLYELSLAYNSLNGCITEAHFTNLTNLSKLDLSYNHLEFNISQGWVPPFSADELILCSCVLGPKFPTWLKAALTAQFSVLCISEAGISDTIPASFWKFDSRADRYYMDEGLYLNVSHNDLKGRLPTSLATQRYTVFDVSSNSFEGLVPQLVPDLLIAIELSNNSFFGMIPSSFTAAERLRYFSLSHNRINNSIPSFFCQMTSLEVLDLSNNELSGTVPDCWDNSSSPLKIIDLSSNSLSGCIPDSIGSLTQLKSLHLANNHLSGGIPCSLKHCNSLVTLDLGENILSGSIPPWIGDSFSSLRVLRLRSNLFEGSIPDNLSHLASLQVLDLAQNNLSGGLPATLGNFTAMLLVHVPYSDYKLAFQRACTPYYYCSAGYVSNVVGVKYYYIETLLITAKGEVILYTTVLPLVTSIDLSNNNLSGEIPQELTNLNGLHFMNLTNNHLIGRIPANIGAMSQLESLDLSNNNLSGIIPSNMSALNFLSYLNLSNNNLSGRIPTGNQFQTFNDPSIYGGNPDLCGWPLPKCHGDEPPQSPSNTSTQEHVEGSGDESEVIWLYASSAVGFVAGFWAFVGTLMIKRAIRIAYFRCIDMFCDLVFVRLTVNFNRLKTILMKSSQDRC